MRRSLLGCLALVGLGVAACQPGVDPAVQTQSAAGTATAQVTVTLEITATITPTPQPLAVSVNGVGVLLSEYSASLTQLQAAAAETGQTYSADEMRQMVLDDLVDQALLANAAAQDGFSVDEAALDARYAELVEQSGGEEALNTWIQSMGYDSDSFRAALQRQIAAAWQRDQIMASVPKATEQVRARQILVRSQETADSLYARLQNGADFATLAAGYDLITSGELGWFPKGYLTVSALDEAVFALQPGEYTPVISTDLGYVILQVEERSTEQPLSPDALLTLQQQALDEWLAAQQAASQIQIEVP